MMNIESVDSFKQFLSQGALGLFAPRMSMQEVTEICTSMNEAITLGYVGSEGIEYGRLLIFGESEDDFKHNPVNRLGVNFWTPKRTKLLENILWYEPLSKMSRYEVYALLRKMGIPFFEVVRQFPDGTSYSEEISIGQVPSTLLAFYTPESANQEIPYHITWFRDGLDESNLSQLKEPST